MEALFRSGRSKGHPWNAGFGTSPEYRAEPGSQGQDLWEEIPRGPDVFGPERGIKGGCLREDVLDVQVKKEVKQYGDQKQRQGNEGHKVDLIAHCLEVFH